MHELAPCPDCDRHIRIDEAACPFCSAAIETPPAPRRLPIGRLTRAAVFAGALLAMAGCGDDDGGPPPDAGPPDASIPLPYGAPPARTRLV